ncbi:MAG: hypothetical protein AB7U75_13785 [Hyphomicrobiaceae bacterium]
MPNRLFYEFASMSENDIEGANRVCNDRDRVTDDSGATNQDKWLFASRILNEGETPFSIFDVIDFEKVYFGSDYITCEAAAIVAELRTQYLQDQLDANPNDLHAHNLYVKNRLWQTRLRERHVLRNYELNEVRATPRLT